MKNSRISLKRPAQFFKIQFKEPKQNTHSNPEKPKSKTDQGIKQQLKNPNYQETLYLDFKAAKDHQNVKQAEYFHQIHQYPRALIRIAVRSRL